MHLTNSITKCLRCLDRPPKKNIQHVFLKVAKHKQPCLTAEMLGKHTWNIWSLFSKSFTHGNPTKILWFGISPASLLGWCWIFGLQTNNNGHVRTSYDICIINTSIQIYSLLISTIQYLYPCIYIYHVLLPALHQVARVAFPTSLNSAMGSDVSRSGQDIGAAASHRLCWHQTCDFSHNFSEKLSHKKGKTQP